LGAAIRIQQDADTARSDAATAFAAAVSRPPGQVSTQDIAALRRRLAELETKLAEVSGSIAQRFPEYDAMVSSAPVSLPQTQTLLRKNEALVLFLVEGEKVFGWAIRPGQFTFRKLSTTSLQLGEQVEQLRRLLDPEINGGARKAYDIATARAVYDAVLKPFEATLNGATHLVVIADGALQKLPLHVLVSGERDGRAEWLLDRFAISAVPSVSALRALRTFVKMQHGQAPLIGFGDPILDQGDAATRRPTAKSLFGTARAAGGGTAPAATTSLRRSIADVEQIRRAPALPETANELKAIANTLKAPANSLHLGADATEARVKRLDLTQYRVVAFATHAVIAGELAEMAEPGLILTPPKEGTLQDDGFLAASEVAQLKLNAQWVLLSACNTGASDGLPGAEGLSGLAKGFFHAGARSLLVSHWYVVSEPTVRITTEMLRRYEAEPGLGRAEALRRSMQLLRASPKYAHPQYWAPFIVVGEGGR
jgi:CHAT domain-containing protein